MEHNYITVVLFISLESASKSDEGIQNTLLKAQDIAHNELTHWVTLAPWDASSPLGPSVWFPRLLLLLLSITVFYLFRFTLSSCWFRAVD